MTTTHIYVLGGDPFNMRLMRQMEGAETMIFHQLLAPEEIVHLKTFDMPKLMQKALKQVRQADYPPDAVVGYWDFPSITLLPILQYELGLRGADRLASLRCEHKYFSRVAQAAAGLEHVPRFAACDPFREDVLRKPPLPYPFWVKPVRAHSSMLGFQINNAEDWAHAIDRIRREIGFLARPFNDLMNIANAPAELQAIDGFHVLAEELVSSDHQCTVEGYVLDGDIGFIGVIDSLREGRFSSSFSSYQYPSVLPDAVQQRLFTDCRRFLRHVGYDNATFNIEFYYDEASDVIRILEVNTRISKSHSPLFAMVDGSPNLKLMVDVALGRHPRFPDKGGQWPCAAKFMLRKYHDARVVYAPSDDDIQQIEDEIPGCSVQVEVPQGSLLSELTHQDSYSYEYATVFVGGQDAQDLERKKDLIESRLGFQFEAVD